MALVEDKTESEVEMVQVCDEEMHGCPSEKV